MTVVRQIVASSYAGRIEHPVPVLVAEAHRAQVPVQHPNLPLDILMVTNDMSIEYLMTLIQVNKAIFEGDTKAYKVLMDSLYGTPIRQIDLEAQIKEDQEIIINYNKPIEFNYEALTSEELRILLKALDKEEITK